MFPSILFAILACGEKEEQTQKEVTVEEPGAEPSAEDTGEEDDTAEEDSGDLEVDSDGDGFTEESGDCDDDDSSINPDAAEIPGDGIDQDCDGEDEELDPTELHIDDVAAGELVITEIMNDPDAVPQEQGEWFEIYNAGSYMIDLLDLQVRDDGQDVFTVTESLIINPGGYVVFGANGSVSQNGGAHVDFEYDYNSFILGNGSDEIVLLNSSGEIDRVDYNDSLFPAEDGISMSLDKNFFDAAANDDGQNWCTAQNAFGDGDLGTPAGPNLSCPVAPDRDGDGFTADVDCDDNDPLINPDQVDDVCNGVDADCDGNVDEDWSENTNTGLFYEPNQDINTAYQLGNDSNIGGTIQANTADLDTAGRIDVSAYIFDGTDVDTYVFTSYDQWNDGGFTVRVESVPSTVDIALAVDFMDQSGNLTTDIIVMDDAGTGNAEELQVSEGWTLTGYSTGTYYVRVYSTNGGSHCADPYELSIVD